MTGFHQKNIPAISWTWQEGRYWDLWMIVHALTGAICASAAVLMGIHPVYAYPVVLLGLTAWEIGEMIFGIKEELVNWILDVVFGMLGFWLVYERVLPDAGFVGTLGVGTLLALFNGLFAFLGWKAYRKRTV